MGAKVYSTSRKNGARFLVPLFDGKTGALLCLMQADYLGQMRTGAASGVATKYMARPDAAEVSAGCATSAASRSTAATRRTAAGSPPR
jgi:ornithine cyclodeaminase/alanine dehydrogenase-like protein (mu-crystallin family)